MLNKKHIHDDSEAKNRVIKHTNLCLGRSQFVVHEEETRKAILVERNAPTPTSLIEGDHQLAEALEALPPHRSNRKSLIANAIEASDRAREARRAGTD